MPASHLVSCIMPTRGRRPFVPLAVTCFLAQDYPERELVVLDDGDEPVRDLLPDDPRIRYERVEERLVLGAKRNLACRLARGELIAHWDDDDWSAPRRLSVQVAALAGGDADIVGLDELLFFDPLSERGWRYTYPRAGQRPWVAGGTLCYRKRFWERHPFPEIGVGEDSRFVWVHDAKVLALRERGLYAATVHPGNTSVKRPRAPRWRPLAAAELAAELDAVRVAEYKAAASGVVAPPAVAAAAPGELHVTVTIPYHRCRPYIRQCVESVLSQTHRELTVVVVNDGDADAPWDLLRHLDDPRLVRFDLPVNRGRYFADQVVLQATASQYLFVHDADDWSEPERLATLLRALRTEHSSGAIGAARPGPRAIELSRLACPLSARFSHLAPLHGVFRTDALRAVGGFYAGFHVGYDTFLVNALVMTGRLTTVAEPLYTWRHRRDSLVHAPETGGGSPLRRATAQQLREMYRSAYAAYSSYRDGELAREALAGRLSDLGAARIAPPLRRELDDHAHRLAGLLAERAHAPAPVTVRARLSAAPAIRAHVVDLLDEPASTWDAWALPQSTAVELAARLDRRRPRRIVELGSGISTAVLAQYAARTSAAVVSLEHDPRFAKRTRALLARLGLAGAVELRVAPLRPRRGPDGRDRPWFDVELPDDVDFALIDAPPMAHGRGAALFALHDHLASDWEAWLHDADRPHEQDCLRLWARHLPFSTLRPDLDTKGVAVLGPAGRGPAPAEAAVPGLGVGVLTGGRPDLLQRTLATLDVLAGPALAAAHVLVLINGHDDASERLVRSLPFVDRVLVTPERRAVGPATSALLAELAQTSGVELILHLEDDWAACTLADGWLARGAQLLRDEPELGQVRLRHRSEPVLRRHMITGKPIVWERAADVERSPAAHFTFNPNLLRAADVRRIYPCSDERSAQQRYLETGLDTVQLTPGVFRHLGDGRSLNPLRRSAAR